MGKAMADSDNRNGGNCTGSKPRCTSGEDLDNEVSPQIEEDPFLKWAEGDPVTTEDLREGLVTCSKYVQASLQSTIKLSSELRRILPSIQVMSDQIKVLGPKVESNARSVDQLDQELVSIRRDLHEVRKAVQGLQVDMEYVKGRVDLLPGIASLLGEVIGRLPSK